MFDPQRLLGQVLSGSFGGLGRKIGQTNQGLSQMGGLGGFGGGAKLGAGLGLLGVAMAAFEHFKERPGTPAAPPPSSMLPPPPPPPPPGAYAAVPAPPPSLLDHMPEQFQVTGAPNPMAQQSVVPAPAPAAAGPALHLLRSMIAAAHADGVLDAQERESIVARAREAQLPPDDLMALGAELNSPQTLTQLIAATPTGLERETYAAALLAISIDTPAEQTWMDQLAFGLRLSPTDRQMIQQQLSG